MREQFAPQVETVGVDETIPRDVLIGFMNHLEAEVNHSIPFPGIPEDKVDVISNVAEIRKRRDKIIESFVVKSSDRPTYAQCKELLELVETSPNATEQALIEDPVFEMLDRRYEWIMRQANERLPILFGVDASLDEDSRPVGTMDANRIPGIIDLVSQQVWCELTEPVLSGLSEKGTSQYRTVMKAKERKMTDSLAGNERVTYSQAVRIVSETRDAAEKALSDLGDQVDPKLVPLLEGREARMCADVIRLLGGHEGYEPGDETQEHPGTITCDEFYSFYSELARRAPELKVVFADHEEEARVSAKARGLLRERGNVHIKGILGAYDKPLTLEDCRDISVKIRSLPKLVELSKSGHSIYAALDVQNAWVSDELDKRLPELFGRQSRPEPEDSSHTIMWDELIDLLKVVSKDMPDQYLTAEAIKKMANGAEAQETAIRLNRGDRGKEISAKYKGKPLTYSDCIQYVDDIRRVWIESLDTVDNLIPELGEALEMHGVILLAESRIRLVELFTGNPVNEIYTDTVPAKEFADFIAQISKEAPEPDDIKVADEAEKTRVMKVLGTLKKIKQKRTASVGDIKEPFTFRDCLTIIERLHDLARYSEMADFQHVLFEALDNVDAFVHRESTRRLQELFVDATGSEAEKPTGPTIHKNELIILLSNFGAVARVEHSARVEIEALTEEVLAECERLTTLQRESPITAVFAGLSDRLTLAECRDALEQVRVQAGLHVNLTNIDHPIFSAMDQEEEWACEQTIEYLSGKMKDANPNDPIDARPPMFVNSESSELFCMLSGCKTMGEHLEGLKEVFIDELGKSDGALYHQRFIDILHNSGSGVASVVKTWSEVGLYAETFLARIEVFCDTLPEPKGARLKDILIEGYRQCFDKSAQRIEEVYLIEGTPCSQSRTHFVVEDEEILIPSEVTSGLLVPPSETGELRPLLVKEVTTADASDAVKAAAKKYGDSTQAVIALLKTENLSYCRFLNLIADLDDIQDEYAAGVSFLSKRVQNLCSHMNDPIIEYLYIQGRAWFVDEQALRMEEQGSGSITRERIWEILRSANRRADKIVEGNLPSPTGDNLNFEGIMKDTVFRLCPTVVCHPAQLREFGFWLVGRIEAIGAMNPNSKLESSICWMKEINENELDGAFREICEAILASADAKKVLDDLEFALHILPTIEDYAIAELIEVDRAVNPKRLRKELCDDLDNRFKLTGPKSGGGRKGRGKKNSGSGRSGNGRGSVNGIPMKVVAPFINRLQAELGKFMDEWMPEQIQTHAPLNAIISFMQECHFQFQYWLSAENAYTDEIDLRMRTILDESLDAVITRYSNYLSGEQYQGKKPFAAADPKKPSRDSGESEKKTYPVPALITKTRTLEDAWREIEERNAMNLQQRELHTVNQVRGFAVSIWNNFRDQCAQLESFNVRDESERDSVTSNARRCVKALETAMIDVVRRECRTSDLSEPLSLRPVEEAALGINITDFSLPPEIAKCFEEAIILGYGSAPDEVQEIDIEPLPILIASQKELIDRGVDELKAGMTCTFLRNMFAGVSTKPVKLNDRECSAVRGKDFSVEWARQVGGAVDRSVDNFVSIRQPRKGVNPEEYVKGLFDSRIQHAIFQRARGVVEESLQRLKTGPSESVIGDLARVLPDLTQGEREASITTDELVGFVRVDLLGDRKPGDSLFPQEIPAIEQYCRNRNLDPNRDVEEQLKEDIAGLNQLAARFDHEFHADINFRREGGGEQLLRLAVQIGARMALARQTADQTSEKRLREQAMDALLQIVHLKDLALIIEANSQWMKEWPIKHAKPDDRLGYWELRYAHEQSEAYLQRCRILGGEAPELAAACVYAEDVKEARERGVIVINGGEAPEPSADDAGEASEGKKKRRTPRSLDQDTKRVKAYVERKAKRREQLAVGEATAESGDMSPELGELVASLCSDDAERIPLETLLRSLPDHAQTIERLAAAIEGAQGQKKQADDLLAELASDSSGEVITQESLVGEAGSIMARTKGLRQRVFKEKQVAQENHDEEAAKNVAASQRMDQLANDGVTDPPIIRSATNIMNNSAARRDEHAQRIVALTALESSLEECELIAAECLDHFKSGYPSGSISEDGDIDARVPALLSDANICLDRLEQFKKLAAASADKAEIEGTSERLGEEIARDKGTLKGLSGEQKRRDEAQARLDEIRVKLAAAMQAYESPPTAEQEDA